MSIRNIAIAALLSMGITGNASAIISNQKQISDFQVITVHGSVNTHLSKNGTATLHGLVKDQFDADQAEAEALKIAGVSRVINLLTIQVKQ